MLRKLINLIAIYCIISIVLLFNNKTVKGAEYTQEQSCGNTNPTLYENVSTGGEYSQSFYPIRNTIDQIMVGVGSNGASGTATISLKDSSGATLYQDYWSYSSLNAHVFWYFNSFDPITVTPGQEYKIHLTSDHILYWYKATDCDCTGHATANGYVLSSADYEFAIWSHTVTPPSEPSSDSAEDSNNTPSSSNSNVDNQTSSTAPTTNTDSSIAKPSRLEATMTDNKTAIKIKWQASTTTDISGYNIYRSTSKDKDFQKIAQTEKNVLEYLDSNGLEAGKTYYYFVRAFKDKLESASSETVSVNYLGPDSTTSVSTQDEVDNEEAEQAPEVNRSVQIIWLVLLSILLLAVIYFYISWRKHLWPFKNKPSN